MSASEKKTIIVWPIYFDAGRSRAQGRRVPKSFAVKSPKIEDLAKAAERLKLTIKIKSNASHPTFPWRREGVMIVEKRESKAVLLSKIAKELRKIRKKS